MSFPLDTTRKHETEPGTLAWEQLGAEVDALCRAWSGDQLPPNLATYLPPQESSLRKLLLAELIKVDLEHRWLHHGLPKRLEEYLEEFPELAAEGGLPCDLIYEEFHIRSQTGEPPHVQEYFDRFPAYVAQLQRLLDMQTNKTTSTIISGRRGPEIAVGQQLDDFDLLTRLGKGAFASVYLARQRSMQRLVALKVSTDRGDEPQTLAQLDHAHIVRVYDQRLLPERRLRLLYMQHVAGGTLHGVADAVRVTPQVMRTGKLLIDCVDSALEDRGESPPTESALRRRLSRAAWPEAVCWLGARLAAALDYAHQRGVLHRDVKPANVLLTAEGSPKLADFNVSFSSKLDGATPAAYFGGSLAYMSPEQLEAANPANARDPKELDGRSDVFSLGVMLWELLTGERPFGDEHFTGSWNATLDGLIQRRRQGLPAAALARLPRGIPPGMTEVLLSCLAPEPADRPVTAGELSRQLELCLQPRAQRLFRPSRDTLDAKARRWPLLALVGVGVLGNGAFSGFNILFNIKAVFEQERELHDVFPTFQNRMMPVVNGAIYPLGIAVGLVVCWPVVQAVRRRSSGGQFATARDQAAASACTRALWIGDYLSWMTAVLWFASGIVFATWIHLEIESLGRDVPRNLYAHFVPSQLLWGLIASVQVFFLTNTLSLRAFLPALVQPGRTQGGDDVAELHALGQRSGWYFGVAISTPFVALLLLATATDVRYLAQVGTIAGVGFICSLVAWILLREIQRDVAALAIAMEAGREVLGGSGETSESFWTASR